MNCRKKCGFERGVCKIQEENILFSTMPARNYCINLQKTQTINCMQTINFTPHFFLEMSNRYCKLVILGTLSMPDHSQQKLQYQFLDNFDSYLYAKNKLYLSKIFQRYCKLVILGTLDISGNAHQNYSINLKESLMFICMQIINFISGFFLEIL